MVSTTALAETAALVGDPARANMLAALMDGRALTAAELARMASVAPQTASGHLARLTAAGLLAVERQGRHRYHRLASPGVARMLESIMAVAEVGPAADRVRRPVVVGPRDLAMRAARTCYDHLARIIHEKCAIKAKPLISFTTMRMGCLMKFFAMKSLAQVFGGLGRFRAVR